MEVSSSLSLTVSYRNRRKQTQINSNRQPQSRIHAIEMEEYTSTSTSTSTSPSKRKRSLLSERSRDPEYMNMNMLPSSSSNECNPIYPLSSNPLIQSQSQSDTQVQNANPLYLEHQGIAVGEESSRGRRKRSISKMGVGVGGEWGIVVSNRKSLRLKETEIASLLEIENSTTKELSSEKKDCTEVTSSDK